MSMSHESVITFQNQLASIMDVLLKNAVCEITKLFETSLSEIHSINVTQREMEVCASKLKLQQAGKTPETEEEYSANSGSNKTEFETWDEHLCSGTIDVFGHFVSSDNENVTKTSTAVTDKQDGDSHSEDRDFDQRWNCDLWRDGENSSSEARITQTQPIQVKREIPETDSCCSACGKMPVSVGSLCTTCTGFSHQGAHADSQTSSLLQPDPIYKALVTPLIQRRQKLPRTPASASLVRSVQPPAAPPTAPPQRGQGQKRKRCKLCAPKDNKTSHTCHKCHAYVCKTHSNLIIHCHLCA